MAFDGNVLVMEAAEEPGTPDVNMPPDERFVLAELAVILELLVRFIVALLWRFLSWL